MQRRAADQVLIVVRQGDTGTEAVINSWRDQLPIEMVRVSEPGQVYALNAGLAVCTTDLVAITDDDAAPRPDWLERIEVHFASDPRVGGVGGRDWIYNDGVVELGDRRTVGCIKWFGRIVGDHHLGAGGPRDVSILKGANFAFRRKAIAPIGFDLRLRGRGAQVHNDMLASLAVKRVGWRLIYDPAVSVDHYLGKRHDRDQRGVLEEVATADRAFNLFLALSEIRPIRLRVAAMTWQIVVGTRDAPGLLWLVRLKLQKRDNVMLGYLAARRGWLEAAHLTERNRSGLIA